MHIFSYIYAKVIPIVVYTGGTKWNVSKKFSTQQEHYGKNNYLELKYNLIDINNYDKEKLLSGKTMIEKAMLIEKSKNKKELVKTIEEIIGVIDYNDEVEVDKIKRIIKYALVQKLGEKNTVDFIKQIKSKTKTRKEEYNMILWDRLEAEDMQRKKEIIKETILATIQRMLQFGENDDKIRKYTGATKKDIEEAKRLLSAKS